MGEVILSAYSNEDPIFGLDAIPFLVTSFEEANKLMRVSRAAVNERFAKHGMQVLFSVPWPPQGLYANKPLNSLSDLAGSKWRSYNPYTARMAELIGAQPVAIQAAELPQALATGAVQSFMSSPSMGRLEGLGDADQVLLRRESLAPAQRGIRQQQGACCTR